MSELTHTSRRQALKLLAGIPMLPLQPTLDPLVRQNYKDRFGAALGYLTADPVSLKFAKA